MGKGYVRGVIGPAIGYDDNLYSGDKALSLSDDYNLFYAVNRSGEDLNVKITVYNAIGSKVATVVNEYKTAGNYSVQFNVSNLASGIYLYRMEAGSYSATKKLILLK
jgi:PKD repeat protein